jgi:small subunit ribosomal protein S3Ae
MGQTHDKIRSLVKKWRVLIESKVDVKTSNGFVMRIFALGFTKRQHNQIKRSSYAQTSQIRLVRKHMLAIMKKEATKCHLDDLIRKFISEGLSKQIEKTCSGFYPLHNCMIRKVKMLKAPSFESSASR